MFLEPVDTTRPDAFGKPVDDLDAGQAALVYCAVECLAGEGLLMDCAVGISVKKTAKVVLQLMNAFDSDIDQLPGKVLIVEPFTAFDRVHEMALNRIVGRQDDIVAALNHSGAAAFAEEPFDGDGDVLLRRRLMRMQGGEEACPSAAEDQDIRL